MCHANNEKRKMIYDGTNSIIKSRTNQNARRKGNLQIRGAYDKFPDFIVGVLLLIVHI